MKEDDTRKWRGGIRKFCALCSQSICLLMMSNCSPGSVEKPELKCMKKRCRQAQQKRSTTSNMELEENLVYLKFQEPSIYIWMKSVNVVNWFVEVNQWLSSSSWWGCGWLVYGWLRLGEKIWLNVHRQVLFMLSGSCVFSWTEDASALHASYLWISSSSAVMMDWYHHQSSLIRL